MNPDPPVNGGWGNRRVDAGAFGGEEVHGLEDAQWLVGDGGGGAGALAEGPVPRLPGRVEVLACPQE